MPNAFSASCKNRHTFNFRVPVLFVLPSLPVIFPIIPQAPLNRLCHLIEHILPVRRRENPLSLLIAQIYEILPSVFRAAEFIKACKQRSEYAACSFAVGVKSVILAKLLEQMIDDFEFFVVLVLCKL